MWKGIVMLLCLAALFYFLYMQGLLVLSAKRAVMFVGSIRGGSNCKARFSSCGGSMRRVMKFREDKTYKFSLESELSQGEMEVKILDASKQPALTLDSRHTSALLAARKKQRYYLVFSFTSATGSYTLSWE